MNSDSTHKLIGDDEIKMNNSNNIGPQCGPAGCGLTIIKLGSAYGCSSGRVKVSGYQYNFNFYYFDSCYSIDYRDSGFSHASCATGVDGWANLSLHYEIFADTWGFDDPLLERRSLYVSVKHDAC